MLRIRNFHGIVNAIDASRWHRSKIYLGPSAAGGIELLLTRVSNIMLDLNIYLYPCYEGGNWQIKKPSSENHGYTIFKSRANGPG